MLVVFGLGCTLCMSMHGRNSARTRTQRLLHTFTFSCDRCNNCMFTALHIGRPVTVLLLKNTNWMKCTRLLQTKVTTL